MKIVKKILKILGIVILLLLVALIVLPIIFSDEIMEKVKTEINSSVDAKINFGKAGIVLLKGFPNITVDIADVDVVGVGDFEGDTLAHIGALEVTVDLMSIIGGMDPIGLRSFGLVDSRINAIVMKDGTTNWDIAKDTGVEEAPTTGEEPSAFNMKVNHYYIENAQISYSDTSMGAYAKLINFSHEGSGDFTQDNFVLETITECESITAIFGGVPYLNKVELYMKIDLDIDMANSKYAFNENEIQLNELFLGFDGWVAMKGDDVEMDVKYNTKQTEFRNILSLVPAVFTRDFSSVKTSGKLALDGWAKGISNDNTIPGFGLNLNIENGRFQYPGLPKAAENIQVDLKVTNPGGDADKTVVDLSNHVELGGQPVDVKLHVETPISDPNINCTVKSQLNLANLKDVIPMKEGESYSGSVTADLNMKGRMSAIEQGRYQNFVATGQLIVLDMDYKDPETPYTMNIKKMYFTSTSALVTASPFSSFTSPDRKITFSGRASLYNSKA